MAIQFQCPYCAATMRVPDAAAGKQTTCPSCQSDLLVPEVRPPAGLAAPRASPPLPEPGEFVPPLGLAGPALSGPAAACGESPVPPLVPDPGRSILPHVHRTADSPPARSDSLARRLRRRRRLRSASLLVPAVCVGLFLAVAVGVLLGTGPKLEGELTAVVVSAAEPASGGTGGSGAASQMIDRGQFVEQSPDDVNAVLDGLARMPLTFKSELMIVELVGRPEGMLISLSPTSRTRLFRVDPGDSAPLRAYAREHHARLNAPRRRELAAALNDFVPAYLQAEQSSAMIRDAVGFRNRLALCALVDGLGYHLEAVVGRNVYRCVYEDAHGLYFLLPRETKLFQIRGRTVAGGRHVPADYTVRLSETP